MTKHLIFLATIFLFACSDSTEQQTAQPMDKSIKEVWAALQGSYMGTYYIMNTDKVWYTETITFKPYSDLVRIIPIYTTQEGEVYAYGEAEIEDTRFTNISGISHCYYVINNTYQNNTLTLSFYEFDPESDNVVNIINDEDKRNIKEWSSSQFKMWGYGLTEAENSVIYEKQ